MDLTSSAAGGAGRREFVKLERVDLHLPIARLSRSTAPSPAKVGGVIQRLARRAEIVALSGVDLTLHAGDRLAILGHNGAGKTSLMRVMAGIYQPSAGRCILSARVSALFSATVGMSANNTGRANIRQACAMFGVPRGAMAEFEREVIEFSELGDYVDVPVSAYSAGMRTRLGFSIVSGLDPELLVVDEVLSAGDAHFAEKARRRILEMVERANAIVVAAHSGSLLRMFCNRAIWLERGRIHMDGPFEEVWKAYRSHTAPAKP